MTARGEWTWMPHAGHFIGGSQCAFHVATHVGGYIVSTVGEYYPRGEGGGESPLGYMRRYETMVFPAKQSPSNPCCPWVMSDAGELDFAGYNEPGEAFMGHMAMCEKWAAK